MQSVHLIDDYDEKIYMIQNNKNEWYNLSHSMISTSAETELTHRWVVIKSVQIVKIEKNESKNKTDEEISDEKINQIEINSMNEDLYETNSENWSCLFQIWREKMIQ